MAHGNPKQLERKKVVYVYTRKKAIAWFCLSIVMSIVMSPVLHFFSQKMAFKFRKTARDTVEAYRHQQHTANTDHRIQVEKHSAKYQQNQQIADKKIHKADSIRHGRRVDLKELSQQINDLVPSRQKKPEAKNAKPEIDGKF